MLRCPPVVWSRSNRITPPSPPASACVTGSFAPIVRPRNPTSSIRATLARSLAESAEGVAPGGVALGGAEGDGELGPALGVAL